MVKLYHPGGEELFQSLAGILDFYYYKGQLCARSLPQHCNQPGTPEQKVTWNAFKTSWETTRKLTVQDVEAFKRLSSGSQLTWTDACRKAYMRGYNYEKRDPPVLYDVFIGVTPIGPEICWTNTRGGVVRFAYWIGFRSDMPKLWEWEYTTLTDPPPNCRKKVDLRMMFPEYDQVGTILPGARQCKTLWVIPRHQMLSVVLYSMDRWGNVLLYQTGVYEYG